MKLFRNFVDLATFVLLLDCGGFLVGGGGNNSEVVELDKTAQVVTGSQP